MKGDWWRKEQLLVPSDAAGARLDRFLSEALPQVSRKAVKRSLDGGRVFVDGRCVRRAGELLRGGEVLLLTLDSPQTEEQPIALQVIWQDDELLAVNKPAGVPSHPTVAGRTNMLDVVRQQCGVANPILLHRLDAGTSGVLLFALTAEANRELSRQFAERQLEKIYLALVSGEPPELLRIENYLKAGVRGRTVAVQSGGQAALTECRTLAAAGGIALVEAQPHTGRTHQIRVHLAEAGYPLLGDVLYGGAERCAIAGQSVSIQRFMLHARQLRIRHPRSGAEVELSAELPDDFLQLCRRAGIVIPG